ncbi:hypothetical protein BaRGS_00025315 [Batillaria attramentaria]|uniref:Uncharacterized protein n=1 Tax=Batillaria attramentaria TaxID=370345 RepID=A0ABD0K8E6_9CAEN
MKHLLKLVKLFQTDFPTLRQAQHHDTDHGYAPFTAEFSGHSGEVCPCTSATIFSLPRLCRNPPNSGSVVLKTCPNYWPGRTIGGRFDFLDPADTFSADHGFQCDWPACDTYSGTVCLGSTVASRQVYNHQKTELYHGLLM